LFSSCTTRLPLPDEPEAEGGPSGEIAYVVQYRWEEVPQFGDIVLASGILFAIEDSTRIHAYLSDKASAVINEGFSFPDPIVADGITLSHPVQMAVGTNKSLWVAFLQPDMRVVQFRIASPPEATGLWVGDAEFEEFGGITADGDSGFVYVADAKANTIVKYAPSETGGSRVALLASEGSGDHFVRVPRGIFCFGDSLLVADSDKSWVQVLDADVPFAGRGQVQGPADAPLVLHTPVDVWVDTSGRYYVAEQGGVLQITPEGRIKEVVTELDPQAAALPQSLSANTTQVWVPDPAKRQCTVYQINTVTEELP
jgi:DNA-binding beta-propeller fold protein YncE